MVLALKSHPSKFLLSRPFSLSPPLSAFPALSFSSPLRSLFPSRSPLSILCFRLPLRSLRPLYSLRRLSRALPPPLPAISAIPAKSSSGTRVYRSDVVCNLKISVKWYRGITRLRIGRPMSEPGGNISYIQSQILKISNKILANCGYAAQLEERTPIDFSSFIEAVRVDVLMLKDACLADIALADLEIVDNAGFKKASRKSGKGELAKGPAGKGTKKRKNTGKVTKSSIPSSPRSPMVSNPSKRSKRLIEKLAQHPETSKPTIPKQPVKSDQVSSPIPLSPRRSPRLIHTHQSPRSPIKVAVHGSSAKPFSKSPFNSSPWSVPGMDSTSIPFIEEEETGTNTRMILVFESLTQMGKKMGWWW